jgi:GST-like protein
MMKVYGAEGSGSVAVEAALTLMGVPYELIDADPWGPAAARDLLEQVSPLKQVPVLELEDGRRITESAAILLWFGDSREGRPFCPALADPVRPEYLRWMVYVPAAIYPMYALKDNVWDWARDGEAQIALTARALDRVIACWKVMEAQTSPRPYILGDHLTFLDLYVTIVSRWSPGRDAFAAACPKLAEVVRRVDADPRLQALWAKRFPLPEAG